MASMLFQFRLAGASSVSLAGDFNGWSTVSHSMEGQDDGLWSIEVDLSPGRQEYKFFVDGQQWWNDPEATTVPNLWGTENSYVEVSGERPS